MMYLNDLLQNGVITAEQIAARLGTGFLVLETLPTASDSGPGEDIFRTMHVGGAAFLSMSTNLLRNPEMAPLFPLAPRDRSKFMITVGRTGTADVRLDHKTISKLHAWFRYDRDADTFRLTDADSTNGTKLSGAPLEPNKAVELKGGDSLAFGARITARFHTPRTLALYLKVMLRRDDERRFRPAMAVAV